MRPTASLILILLLIPLFSGAALGGHPSSVYYEERVQEVHLDDESEPIWHALPSDDVARITVYISLKPWHEDDTFNDHCESLCATGSTSGGQGSILVGFGGVRTGSRLIAANDVLEEVEDDPALGIWHVYIEGNPSYTGPMSILVIAESSGDIATGIFLRIIPLVALAGVVVWLVRRRRTRARAPVEGDDGAVDPAEDPPPTPPQAPDGADFEGAPADATAASVDAPAETDWSVHRRGPRRR